MTADSPKLSPQGSSEPPPAGETFVAFENVQKSYDGETLTIRDLNMTIKRGEFLTMLGPSGSGKTTCLMMLAGFEVPTQGRITLAGRPITHIPPHKRGLGMVFQNYALFPHMTVGENLAFPLRVRKYSATDIEERVLRVLDMVQMGDFVNRRPAQLSGGQQQRIALARALVFDPELVLMDEPLGALDKQLREHMQYEIKHIHEKLGVTVLYVTHDQSEALTMSNRIAVFNNGEVQQIASPSDIYEYPENSFVANFIGENNRLAATIEDSGDQICTARLASGEAIKATRINVVGAVPTSLSIRPERIHLEPDVVKTMDNQFTGVVQEIIYLGDHYRVCLRLCGHDQFIVKAANATSHQAVVEGDTLLVGWNAADCRALDVATAIEA